MRLFLSRQQHVLQQARLTNNTWFDESGHAIMTLPAGSSLYTKTVFDSLGRTTVQYRGYNLGTMSYADAFDVTNDVVMEQAETVIDEANNVIQTTARQRYHNAPASQTGALQNPSTTPKARVKYAALWQDEIGRTVARANYGTNGGSALSRPDTIPAASDTVLVIQTVFDSAGNIASTIDPAGMVTCFEYDDVGRKITQIDNCTESSSSSSSSSSSGDDCAPSDDQNRTTQYTYTPDGQQVTMTAFNSETGNQTTTWTYGTTLGDSNIASSQLLQSITYPGSVGGGDLVAYTYNRQGERISMTDQRGCVHSYLYDKLGRQIHDCVTTPGTGVDTSVLRLSTTYEVRGMGQTLTSWNNPSVTSGDAVNQCQLVYNSFQQLIADYQEHYGEVNTTSTPVVQYAYADGSLNTVCPISITYPNGRVITYSYGTSDGIDDAISRIDALVDSDVSSTVLVDYQFLGLGVFVNVDYSQPQVEYTLLSLTGSNDPITGDIYAGLDLFGRVKDCRWYNYGSSTDVARLQYGYDQASNRLWREDLVAQSLGQAFDELYAYDGLHRLNDVERGLLSSDRTSVTSETLAQCWTLDSTSNWSGFREADNGDAWTTVQARSASTVNEIVDIINTVGSAWVIPAYDAAGNMTTLPQPTDPTAGYAASYDAWNRMSQLLDTSTSDIVLTNTYDARGCMSLNTCYVSGILSTSRHMYYSIQWRSIEERVGTAPDDAGAERQHIYGQRYLDDIVVRDRSTTGSALNERLFWLQDVNWNVTALIAEEASVQEMYVYTPYGCPMFLDSTMSVAMPRSLVDIDKLFTGQRYNSATGCYLFMNRWYIASGVFLSRDPIGTAAGTNLYSYPMSNPIASTDPYGLCAPNQCVCNQLILLLAPVDTLAAQQGVQQMAGKPWDATSRGFFLDVVVIATGVGDITKCRFNMYIECDKLSFNKRQYYINLITTN